MHHPHDQGRSTIAVRFQHLIAQQGSHGVINGTNHSVLTIRASSNTQDTTRVILQHVLRAMKGILATNMAILTQTSKIIHTLYSP